MYKIFNKRITSKLTNNLADSFAQPICNISFLYFDIFEFFV